MSGAITGFDHVLIGVADLEAARATYRRLGFTTTPRGSHIGWGTANYCIMFDDDYVELLGIVDPEAFTNNLDVFLEDAGEGLMGLALATPDAAAVADELRARGIAAAGPRDLARRLELPGGTVLPEFKLVHPPAEATPGVALFVCQHLTPALIRRPEWLDHPNGARGLATATALVEDARALASAYERVFGAGAVTLTDDVATVRIGRHALLLAPPEGFERLHPGASLPEDPRLPALVAMAVRVGDVGATARVLGEAGVAFERTGPLITVPPEETHGLWLEFVGSGL